MKYLFDIYRSPYCLLRDSEPLIAQSGLLHPFLIRNINQSKVKLSIFFLSHSIHMTSVSLGVNQEIIVALVLRVNHHKL